MKKRQTFRQLISSVIDDGTDSTGRMMEYLYKRDEETMSTSKVTRGNTIHLYSDVIRKLSLKPKVRPYKYSILVSEVDDWGEDKGKKFIDVSLLNPTAINPPKGKLPWGGKDFPKKTHYNINNNKYSKYFAFGYVKWGQLIDTPVINEVKRLKHWELLAEILWELTFHGFTEEDCESFNDHLKIQLEVALKEVKEGKCSTIPKAREGGLDVVIPDSVAKQLGSILKKKKK